MALESMVRIAQARPRIAGADTPRQGVRAAQRPGRPPRRARCCWPWRAWCCRAGAAVSPTRSSACSRYRPPRRALRAAPRARSRCPPREVEGARELEFFNGLGGFAAQGREYVVAATGGQITPAPWINVIANRGFGFHVSTDGAGYTWARNSRENALTPWSNDPVTRPSRRGYLPARRGERRVVEPHAGAHPPRAGALLLRAWLGVQPLPAALPWRRAGADADASRPRIRSRSAGSSCATNRRAARNLSVTRVCRVGAGARAHAERAAHHHRATTRTSGALLARNPWNHAFPGVAFAGSRRPAVRMDLRSARVPRPARHAGCAGGAGRRRRAGRQGRRGARSLRRAAQPLRARARREHQFPDPVRRGDRRRRSRARCIEELPRHEFRCAARRACARSGASSRITCR